MTDTNDWDAWSEADIDHMLADIAHQAAGLLEAITWHQFNTTASITCRHESRTAALKALDQLRELMNRDHQAVEQLRRKTIDELTAILESEGWNIEAPYGEHANDVYRYFNGERFVIGDIDDPDRLITSIDRWAEQYDPDTHVKELIANPEFDEQPDRSIRDMLATATAIGTAIHQLHRRIHQTQTPR